MSTGIITMEDRGCTPELLRKLYIEENNTQTFIKEMFNIKDDKVLNRWFAESGIKKKEKRGIYSFNENFFDEIDTEEKAYWLGFIWCDGYVCRRIRNGRDIYEFKLDLALQDKDHIEKFKNSLNSTHPIKTYQNKSGFKTGDGNYVARLYLANKYFAKTLYSEYGLIANRSDISKLIDKVPFNLIRHFIRGVLDADGSFSLYYHQIKEHWKPDIKMNFSIYTYENLIEYIQNYFIQIGMKNNTVKTLKRHKDGDMYCTGLNYAGAVQVPKLLNYLYKDATIFLERKHKKYIEINKIINEKRIVK